MSRSSAAFMWIACALMAGVFLFPLWTIDLQAPQYPDGLGIRIWIDKITGRGQHDLQNINGLNHYIGMRAIEQDAISELVYMKYVAALLIAFAATVAFLRRRWLLAVFVVTAVGVSVAGMYDFWKWGYDYGHNLDPSAAIKVPGMSYQPPLFGSKQLLNFTSTAWPGIGGMCAMLAVGLSVAALLIDLVPRGGARRGRAAAASAVLMATCLLAAGCSREPRAIEYGSDACAFCRMMIADQRYGAEAVTNKGRVYTYDSIECLVGHGLASEDVADSEIHGYYVTDFGEPGRLIDATSATYLRSEDLPSPMGLYLTASSGSQEAERMRKARGGSVMNWDEVRAAVAESGYGR